MDGRFEPEEVGPTGDLKSSPSPKRSRRSVQKRVVSIPISEVDGSRSKGAGEGAPPPSDSWAWRKYGQKPIKGSPYPRGYYRCSSSKGCPARKQVERSRVDPTMLVVTYSCDHNHPWPLPKNHHQQQQQSSASAPIFIKLAAEENPAPVQPSPPDPADLDEKFADLIGEDSALEFGWFADVGSPSSTSPPPAADAILCGPIFGCSIAEAFGDEGQMAGGGVGEEEEDALFAGLGELPECSAVFRRSQAVAAAWCGSTG